jgi:hypothetical protein
MNGQQLALREPGVGCVPPVQDYEPPGHRQPGDGGEHRVPGPESVDTLGDRDACTGQGQTQQCPVRSCTFAAAVTACPVVSAPGGKPRTGSGAKTPATASRAAAASASSEARTLAANASSPMATWTNGVSAQALLLLGVASVLLWVAVVQVEGARRPCSRPTFPAGSPGTW